MSESTTGASSASTDSEFDWRSDDSIAVRSSDAVAVYLNRFNQVVIRKQASWDEDEDTFIYLDPLRVPALVKALHAAAREAKNAD